MMSDEDELDRLNWNKERTGRAEAARDDPGRNPQPNGELPSNSRVVGSTAARTREATSCAVNVGVGVGIINYNDIDDAYSVESNWSGFGAAMRRGGMKSNLLPRHLKRGVGLHEQKVAQGSSPEFMSYVHQGLVEMRKVQASTLGTRVKKREYKELLSSSKAARRKTKQAMCGVEVLIEKHASLFVTRMAPVR